MASTLGAVRRGIPLRPKNGQMAETASDLVLDLDELEAAICDRRTRVLVLNTPHNPTGKVFSRDELEGIASVLKRHPGIIAVSDEVYEYSVFAGKEHVRFATLPGMWDRTISLYSAGKTFSCTGWRVGYSIGPAKLIEPMIYAQSVINFCSANPMEIAVASAMEAAATNGYFDQLPALLEAKADVLGASLANAGLAVVKPEGGYFVVASAAKVGGEAADAEEARGNPRDMVASEFMTTDVGVCCLPTSVFYAPQTSNGDVQRDIGAGDLLRFCFVKTDAELAEAGKRLLAANFEFDSDVKMFGTSPV
jgi:aspartate/methionine/tyrosine aminotransferase